MMHTRTAISSFMDWAERRIAEEVAANESFANESGTVAAIKESTHLPHSLTDDQKIEMIHGVDHLRRAGMGSKKACNQIGLHISTYSQWRKRFGMERFNG